MWKVRKTLTPKQLWKAKFSFGMAFVMAATQLSISYFSATAQDTDPEDLVYNGETFVSTETQEFPRGRIVYFSSNTEVCNR